jgi:hypothetical protein
MKFTQNSAPVKSRRILLVGFLTASWLAAASTHANTISATNTNDCGPGSLRQAIADASNGDTINATSIFGSIKLSSGELLVNKNVTINGPGAEKLSVENTRLGRVFEIAAGEIVTFSGLAISSGQAIMGGGIYNAGRLEVMSCSISGNEAGGLREHGLGGGIYNGTGAEITIINSTITGNNAGGLFQESGLGGGIYNDTSATLAIINCIVSSNRADQGGGIYKRRLDADLHYHS